MDHVRAPSTRAYPPQQRFGINELKRRFTDAFENSMPSPKSKIYKHVKVFICYWTGNEHLSGAEARQLEDCFQTRYGYGCSIVRISKMDGAQERLHDLLRNFMLGADKDDLLIFHYMGGQHHVYSPGGQLEMLFISEETPVCPGQPLEAVAMTLRPRDWLFNSINFSKLKADTLDTAKADVLYLLDCKYEISTPIGPGKELIAAVHKKSSVPPTGAAMRSFTAAITQELNDAVDAAPKYLTTAQLYAKLQVEHVAKGHLRFSPMHANIVTNMVTGAQARPSILLAPLPTKAPLSIEPSLIGCGFWDLRVILSVHLPDNAPGVCAGLKEWLSKDRPLSIGLGGLSFSLGPASTNSLVFTMSVTAYYVLKGNPAFRRVGYTSCPLWHIVPPWPHEPRADVYESLQGSPGHPYSLALPPQ